ncbi:MAG: YcxB family protein [Lachnospiraceae bacterium]|nr:YcxB family protein [Ruminococcus sp.]MCM1274784.1 YcxB family protein [Lachnospiraceae bacterium]
MKTFQRRFYGKKGILWTSAFALFSVAAVVGIVLDPSAVFMYLALLFCLFMLVNNITSRKRMRARIINALKDMNPEEYRCAIYPEKIEIETVIKPKEGEEAPLGEENGEEALQNAPLPVMTVFRFGDDLLNFDENEDSLLLIFNRRQIYCFPKRCLGKETEDAVREFLYNKLENDGG